jgi:hypothetical protein
MAEHRKPSHFPRCCSCILIKAGDAYIELIEDYPCDNKEQLNRREGQIIRERECVNDRIAGRTSGEYAKDNPESVKKYKQKYREANREALRAKNKTYRKANRQAISTNRRAYYENNTYRQDYYKANKEVILAWQRAYRALKKAKSEATESPAISET